MGPVLGTVKTFHSLMLPINEIAAKIGLSDEDLEPCGRYTAKVRLNRFPPSVLSPKGKLILVTAMTPTLHGEGKTVVSIGLAQAIEKLGKKSMVTLREPSLGPVFGIKGGATGGGKSQVLPAEKINLHFNGDKHAVAAAHNLLAAMLDAHIYHGNELRIDPDNIFWPRTVDMNDRALRQVTIGLSGKAQGKPRNSRFVITAASEVMAVLALANSPADCARRLGEMTVAFDRDGAVVRANDLQATGAMMVLLHETIMPNLVQTTEHTAALIHAGPFGNIAHGTSSVIAQRVALETVDFVVNEAGFGADLGAEKYLDIVMPSSSLRPSVAVLVVTARGIKHQSESAEKGKVVFKDGFANLSKHIENLRKFRLPIVVALNRFPEDSTDEIRVLLDFCAGLCVEAAVTEVFHKGGEGGIELAQKVLQTTAEAEPDRLKPLYTADLSIEDKIAVVAREIYGARSVNVDATAKHKLEKFSALGFSRLPVCIAKTQYSLSDDPKKLGAPKDYTMTVTDAHLASGAGFIVAVAGNMMLMPGLPKSPQATRMSLQEDGSVIGII